MANMTDDKRAQSEFSKKNALIITPPITLQPHGLIAHEESDSSIEEKHLMREGERDSPFEDLMREHGVLNRILLIYEEILSRMESRTPFPPEVLMESARLIRGFIEDHHGKLEEDWLFPRFEKAQKLVDLVRVLREQHQAGRWLTDNILALAAPASFQTTSVRKALASNMRLFSRMFRPHAAREDTVLFPAFFSIVSPDELNAVVEELEARELELSDKDANLKIMEMVADMEKTLGIHELSRFTPRI